MQLPELQPIIASSWVDNPMMLWIELNMEFGRLCLQDEPPVDLLSRMWKYGLWCVAARSDQVSNAAAVAFFEHILDWEEKAAILPKITSAAGMRGLRPILEIHHTSEEVEAFLEALWRKANHSRFMPKQ